jgi:tetratricopeptide (TPR) repeat protein
VALNINASGDRLRRALAERQRSEVNKAARELIEQRAPLGRQWQSIGSALLWNGECNLAISAAKQMAVDLNDDPASIYFLGNMLYHSGRLNEALARLEDLNERELPPSVSRVALLNFSGSLLLLLGKKAKAREAIVEALKDDPQSGQAWLTLTDLTNFSGPDAGYVEALQQAYELGPSISNEGTKLAHAMGRCRHLFGDYAGAFTAFDKGARLFREKSAVPDQSSSSIVQASTSYTPELIERVSKQIAVPHDRAIFVTGLPRSGTTLVEQILVSHSAVRNGEELNIFRIVAQEIGGIDAQSFEAWLDRGGDPNRLVELYLHLASERFGPDGRFVDKTIEAGNYMGLLLALFPAAPKLWLRRDPVDNGWSAFRTTFARGATWSWDLRDIGLRLAQEDRMASFWKRQGADQIAFVDYAKLVRDPAGSIPEIAQATGLALEPVMLTPHQTQRTVASASVSQVREPINLKGLGVAEPYRDWLGPMIHAYEEGQSATIHDGAAS